MQALTLKDQALRMTGIFSEIINDDILIASKLEELEIPAPSATTNEGFKLRLVCSKWWARALTVKSQRTREANHIDNGIVKKGRQIYVSNDLHKTVQDRAKKSLQVMASKVCVSDEGDELEMLQLMEKSLSNPNNKLAELMVRMSGFEEYAKEMGHVGEFYTITCPSKYHKFSKGSFNENYQYNPKEAQAYLVKQWSLIRASLARAGASVYGFRVAEPHHDGCPHWHMMLFMDESCRKEVREIIHFYATAEDGEELNHDNCCQPLKPIFNKPHRAPCSARFTAVSIDYNRGTATGYIAKYIAKNIGFGIGDDSEDKEKSTKDVYTRVKAWASTWGIRQFQQIGGAPVSVWRELRRLKDDDLIEDEIINKARICADESNWCEFLKIMGGADAKRVEQSLKLLKKNDINKQTGEVMTNRYSEIVLKVFGVCSLATEQLTRFKKWEILTKTEAENIELDEGYEPYRSGSFSPLEFCL